jgi:cyclopropane-fatty-acyl-phospholipid synthase
MTYSCARFTTSGSTLEEAQTAKYELICRKLGIDGIPGSRLLDVGCGWGSMAMHAARHHGATVVGVALSREQVDEAARRVTREGLDGHVEIRMMDYRDLRGETFDAISSIGMFEHVGSQRMTQYFETLRSILVPTGRLLNHAISKPGGSVLGKRSFVGRYVFPDGELLDVADVVRAMQRTGFEVRDVESLREHYSRTLHHWVANLEQHWDEAVALVGLPRANIWRLYMAASAKAPRSRWPVDRRLPTPRCPVRRTQRGHRRRHLAGGPAPGAPGPAGAHRTLRPAGPRLRHRTARTASRRPR